MADGVRHLVVILHLDPNTLEIVSGEESVPLGDGPIETDVEWLVRAIGPTGTKSASINISVVDEIGGLQKAVLPIRVLDERSCS